MLKYVLYVLEHGTCEVHIIFQIICILTVVRSSSLISRCNATQNYKFNK